MKLQYLNIYYTGWAEANFLWGGTTNKKNEILPNVEEFGNFYSINPQKMGAQAPRPLILLVQLQQGLG